MLKTRITDLFGIEHPVNGRMGGYVYMVSFKLTQPTPEDLAKITDTIWRI